MLVYRLTIQTGTAAKVISAATKQLSMTPVLLSLAIYEENLSTWYNVSVGWNYYCPSFFAADLIKCTRCSIRFKSYIMEVKHCKLDRLRICKLVLLFGRVTWLKQNISNEYFKFWEVFSSFWLIDWSWLAGWWCNGVFLFSVDICKYALLCTLLRHKISFNDSKNNNLVSWQRSRCWHGDWWGRGWDQ